tara:strand:+ start:329 stop:592 length:264 start_codon:yes stop_codon:yes gene_type:complete
MKELDVWLEREDNMIPEVSHYMLTIFDEYIEDSVATASIKFKFENGQESKWYHPPMFSYESAESSCNEEFLFERVSKIKEVFGVKEK